MKILYVTTVSLTLNTFLIPHIKHLIDNGNEVQVASNIDVELSKEFDKNKIKHTKINFSRNPFSLNNRKAYFQIKELQKKEKFDVVHVHTPVASFVTRAALRNEKIKVIYTAHGFHFYKGAPFVNWILYYPLERKAAEWTDTIVTINSEDFEIAKKFKLRSDGQVKLMHGVGIEPEKYNLCVFNRDGYREMLGINKEDFIILILAELNKNKNHIQIIEAMKEIKIKYPNIKVICAGKGPLKNKLINFTEKYKLEDCIKFVGFRSDVKELLYSCDAVGLFSKREGLGKCLLESMIIGKPIIATNTRGPKELIKNDYNGYLVEVGDYKQTIRCVENLYLDSEKNKKFIMKSKEVVRKYYMENVLNEINDYFTEEKEVRDYELIG